MFCFPKWRLMTRVLGSGLIGITILYSGSLIRIGSGTFATLGTFARLFILGGGAKDAQRMKDENPLHSLPWLLSSLGGGAKDAQRSQRINNALHKTVGNR